MDSRRRRRDAARARLRRLRGRAALGALVAAMTLASGAALAHERPRGGAVKSSAGQSLRVGDRGGPVASVQRRLGLTPDGIFGPATERAVKRFQRRRGLAADGIVGPRTASALNVALPARSGSRRGERSLTGTSRVDRALLERIAACESGGNPAAVSRDGRYRGKYQFSRATWRALGGAGDPARASEAEQDRRAAALLRQAGTSPWPNCA